MPYDKAAGKRPMIYPAHGASSSTVQLPWPVDRLAPPRLSFYARTGVDGGPLTPLDLAGGGSLPTPAGAAISHLAAGAVRLPSPIVSACAYTRASHVSQRPAEDSAAGVSSTCIRAVLPVLIYDKAAGKRPMTYPAHGASSTVRLPTFVNVTSAVSGAASTAAAASYSALPVLDAPATVAEAPGFPAVVGERVAPPYLLPSCPAVAVAAGHQDAHTCPLYTFPSPRDS